MAAYLGQIMRITANDGYVPDVREYKLNGKKQVDEWLDEVWREMSGYPDRRGIIWHNPGDFEQRNDIWEKDGSYWSVWDFVKDDSWFEIIIVRAIKL